MNKRWHEQLSDYEECCSYCDNGIRAGKLFFAYVGNMDSVEEVKQVCLQCVADAGEKKLKV